MNDNLHSDISITMTTTPLQMLLDGLIAQDVTQVDEVLCYVRNQKWSSTELLPAVAYLGHIHALHFENEEEIQGSFSTANDKNCNHESERAKDSLEGLVHCILSSQQDYARVRSSVEQSLPLHTASILGHVGIAELVLDAYPDAILQSNKKGKLPIHYAAREGRLEVVELLLRTDPSCARIQSKKQKLPLHFSACDGHRAVSLALLRAFPKSAAMKTQKGRLALHFASRWGHNKLVKDLLAIFPDASKCIDWEGCLPIHDAAREGQHETVRILLKEYPKGVRQTNLRGEIPLFAAARSLNVACVEELVRVWPEGGQAVVSNLRRADGVNEWDWSILELCLRGAVNVMPNLDRSSYLRQSKRARLNCEEEGSHEKSTTTEDDKFLALHASLRSNSSFSLIQRVLEYYANQIFETDECDNTPLHLATLYRNKHEEKEAVFRYILERNPKATFIRNLQGRLPLHSALFANCGASVVHSLIKANEKSVHDFKSMSDRPACLAMQCGCDLEVQYMLIRADPSVVKDVFSDAAHNFSHNLYEPKQKGSKYRDCQDI
mmetsp:Transcript_8469/g.10862  ORF Transcript_8469/g.10862 Transcript_8469/m.10862 type:complete len:550 (-) Transcript_8469:222-1871(-)